MAKDDPEAKDPETAEGDAEVAAPAADAPKSKKKLFIAVGAVVALAAAGGGGWFFMSKPSAPKAASAEGEGEHGEAVPAAEHSAPAGAAQYLSLSPSFVVNLADTDTIRYLQVDMEVMSHDAATLDAVKAASPMIRNNLLLLMSQQHIADIETREGKEKLQAAALAEIQRIMQEQGVNGVEALYFTSFVMQ